MIKTSDLCVDCIYKLLRLTVFLMIDFYPIVNLYNTKYYRLSIKFVCCDKKLKDQLLMYMLVLSIYQCTAKKTSFFLQTDTFWLRMLYTRRSEFGHYSIIQRILTRCHFVDLSMKNVIIAWRIMIYVNSICLVWNLLLMTINW